MKRILFLAVFLPVLVFSQFPVTFKTIMSGSSTQGAKMEGKTFTFGSTDTTQPQNISASSVVHLGLQTTDTVSVIIKYQLSMDGQNWSTVVTLDSSRQTAAGVIRKGLNLSTATLGMFYIRYLFKFTKSNVYGSTTYSSANRKYWAGHKLTN